MKYAWNSVGESWWQHELPDQRRLDVRMIGEKRWQWTVTAAPDCAEITGWSRNFDAAKLRAVLAWRDSARPQDKRMLTLDAINSLTRGAA